MTEDADRQTATGRIALVTGAGTGIGRAVTIALATEGWSVVLAGRKREALCETWSLATAQLQHREQQHAPRCLIQPTDVSDPDEVDALFAAIDQRFGRLDLLFNNAGASISGAPDTISFAQWSFVVGVNLTGAFLCAQGAFRMMRRQTPNGGRIINNGSISAHVPRPDTIAYTATKHAVTGLTKSLALDGRRHNIACGQIDIGNALTAMAAPMQKGVAQASGSIAVEPTIKVEDVARTVLLMASLPLDANILTLTVMATAMPYIGRG